MGLFVLGGKGVYVDMYMMMRCFNIRMEYGCSIHRDSDDQNCRAFAYSADFSPT